MIAALRRRGGHIFALLTVLLVAGQACWSGTSFPLKDVDGSTLLSEPVDCADVTATCGDCHDVEEQTHSLHFNRHSSPAEALPGDCLTCHVKLDEVQTTKEGIITSAHAKPQDTACLSCHGPQERVPSNAHKGLSCVDCHKGSGHEEHNRPSCFGCHSGKGAAPIPLHRGLTKRHMERIACETCHTPASPAYTASREGRILPQSGGDAVLAHHVSLNPADCGVCHSAAPLPMANLRQTGQIGEFREGRLKPVSGWVLLGVVGLCFAHRLIFGVRRVKRVPGEPNVVRFGLLERVVHAASAVSFVVLASTGVVFLLRLDTPLSSLRQIHTLVGPLLILSLLAMVAVWRKDAQFAACDLVWLRHFGGYLGYKGQCPAGKFNAGQKCYYYAVMALGAVLGTTGLAMVCGQGSVRAWAYTLHDFAAISILVILLLHFYLASLANPGALRGIVTGRVTRTWAKHHHPDS